MTSRGEEGLRYRGTGPNVLKAPEEITMTTQSSAANLSGYGVPGNHSSDSLASHEEARPAAIRRTSPSRREQQGPTPNKRRTSHSGNNAQYDSPASPKADVFEVPVVNSELKEVLVRDKLTGKYKDSSVEDYYILFQASHPLIPTVMALCLAPSVTAIPISMLRHAPPESYPVHAINLTLGIAAIILGYANWKLCRNLRGNNTRRDSISSSASSSRNSGSGNPFSLENSDRTCPAEEGSPSEREDLSPLSSEAGSGADGMNPSPAVGLGEAEAKAVRSAKINEMSGLSIMIIALVYIFGAYRRGEAYRDILHEKHGEHFASLIVHKYYYVGSQHYFCTFLQLSPLLFWRMRAFLTVPVILSYPIFLFLGRTSQPGDPAPAVYSFVVVQLIITAVAVGCVVAKEWLQRKRFNAWLSTRLSVYDYRKRRENIDQVIQNMLPPSAFQDLVSNRKILVKKQVCTVSVASIRDFLQWSTTVLPVAAVYMIDTLFSKFDSIVAEKYGAEKLKTTGDTYIASYGLQMLNSSSGGYRSGGSDHNPAPLVRMGIWQSRFSNRLAHMLQSSQQLNTAFNLTIGIHSGPCIGGVFGSQRLWYDCAGEAFEVAQSLAIQCPVAVGLLISSETQRLCSRGDVGDTTGIENDDASPESSSRSGSRGRSRISPAERAAMRSFVTHPFGPDSFTVRHSSGSKELDEQALVHDETVRQSLKEEVKATPSSVFSMVVGKLGSAEELYRSSSNNDSFLAAPINPGFVDSLSRREAFLRICVSRQRAEDSRKAQQRRRSRGGRRQEMEQRFFEAEADPFDGSQTPPELRELTRSEYKSLNVDNNSTVFFNSRERVAQLNQQLKQKSSSNSRWYSGMSFARETGLEIQYKNQLRQLNPFMSGMRTGILEAMVAMITITVALEQTATPNGLLLVLVGGFLAAGLWAAMSPNLFSLNVSPMAEALYSCCVSIIIMLGTMMMNDSSINSHPYIVYAALCPYVFFSTRRVSWLEGSFCFVINTGVAFWIVITTSDIYIYPVLMVPSILAAEIFSCYFWERDQRSYFQHLMMAAVVVGAAENEVLLQRAALRTIVPDCVIGAVSDRVWKGQTTNSIAQQLEEAVLVAIRAPPLPSLNDMVMSGFNSAASSLIGQSGIYQAGSWSPPSGGSPNISRTGSFSDLVSPSSFAAPKNSYLNLLSRKMEERAFSLESLVGAASRLELINSIGDTVFMGGPLLNQAAQRRKRRNKRVKESGHRHGRAAVRRPVPEPTPTVELSLGSAVDTEKDVSSKPGAKPSPTYRRMTSKEKIAREAGEALEESIVIDPFGMRVHDEGPLGGDAEADLRECCWDVMDVATALQLESQNIPIADSRWTVVMTIGPAFACVIGQYRPTFDLLGAGARTAQGLLSAAPNGSCVMTKYFRELLFSPDQPVTTQVRRSMFDRRRLAKPVKWRCRGAGLVSVSSLLSPSDLAVVTTSANGSFSATPTGSSSGPSTSQ